MLDEVSARKAAGAGDEDGRIERAAHSCQSSAIASCQRHSHRWPVKAPKKFENVPSPARMKPKLKRVSEEIGNSELEG